MSIYKTTKPSERPFIFSPNIFRLNKFFKKIFLFDSKQLNASNQKGSCQFFNLILYSNNCKRTTNLFDRYSFFRDNRKHKIFGGVA